MQVHVPCWEYQGDLAARAIQYMKLQGYQESNERVFEFSSRVLC